MNALRRTRKAWVVGAAVAVLAAACGGTDDADGGPVTTPPPTGTEPTDEPEDNGWDETVACAQEEGTVTWYASNIQGLIDSVGEGLQQEYGIELRSFVEVDSNLQARLDTELETGRVEADLVKHTTVAAFNRMAADGHLVAPIGPAFDNPELEQPFVTSEGYFPVNSPVFALAWNTDLVPDGLTDYMDLLDPALGDGLIAINDPTTSPVITNVYLWLEDNYGDDYLSQLAAQNPRIFPSQAQTIELLGSGELAAVLFQSPSLIVPRQDAGAPVDFTLPGDLTDFPGAHFYSAIIEGGPNPCAAQVLANYLVTAEGQDRIAEFTGSVLPNIPGSPVRTSEVAPIDPRLADEAFRTAYLQEFEAMFGTAG